MIAFILDLIEERRFLRVKSDRHHAVAQERLAAVALVRRAGRVRSRHTKGRMRHRRNGQPNRIAAPRVRQCIRTALVAKASSEALDSATSENDPMVSFVGSATGRTASAWRQHSDVVQPGYSKHELPSAFAGGISGGELRVCLRTHGIRPAPKPEATRPPTCAPGLARAVAFEPCLVLQSEFDDPSAPTPRPPHPGPRRRPPQRHAAPRTVIRPSAVMSP
jgi:hypothetical protein